MNVHDHATRTEAGLKAAAAKPCATCNHRADAHRERGYGNPGHEAGRFYCTEPDCPCDRYERSA